MRVANNRNRNLISQQSLIPAMRYTLAADSFLEQQSVEYTFVTRVFAVEAEKSLSLVQGL